MANADTLRNTGSDHAVMPLADMPAERRCASARVWRILGPGDKDTRIVIGENSDPKTHRLFGLRKLRMSLAVAVALTAVQVGSSRAENTVTALQPSVTDTRAQARQGSASAQFELALIYSRGAVVIQDSDQAYWWLRQAARSGHAGAQNDLGVIHGNGYLRSRDPVEAYMWFEISAGNGNANAIRNRRALADRMTGAEIKVAMGLARDWLNWRTA